MGMVCGESADFAILMSDRLALEVGANIRGCFLNVNINADGNKNLFLVLGQEIISQ